MLRSSCALALALLLACDQAAEPDPPAPASVAVTPSAAELTALAATVRLAAAVRDQNGQPMPSATVTWTSDAPAVARVDRGGLVTAVGGGSATVTAATGATSGSAVVTVAQQIAAVRITPDTATLPAIEDTVRLAVGVLDANGFEVPGAGVDWSSSDTAVARVNGSGLVTAARNGWSEIAADAGPATGRAAVTVAQTVLDVAVTPVAASVVEADTVRLSAVASDANGFEVTGDGVAWASVDTLIAVVDSSGLVSGVGTGLVVVGATVSAVTGESEIKVVPPVPTVVEMSADSLTFAALAETAVLTAEVFDQIGRLMEEEPVTWSSTDTAVAAVDGGGMVTAVGNGETVVTADASGATAATVVRVEQVAVSALVTPAADTVALGDTLRLTAAAFDANGHRIPRLAVFDWSSGDTAVAVVDGSGLVTGKDEGTSSMTASAGGVRARAEVTVENPDRAVLVALYEATGGPDWVRHDNWMTNAPLAAWYGVTVNELGRVTRLFLNSNGLTGPIPVGLGDLAALESLNLGFNLLTGPIPSELGNLTKLEVLALISNSLTGPIPAGLGDLAALESLNLGSNLLTGPIPAELGSLTKLEYLVLYGNGLTGPIPAVLGNLTKLEYLDLYRNALTGPIPAVLGNLTKLEVLVLSYTRLTGSIPAELGNLTTLKYLDFSGNALTGALPRTLTALRKLRHLGLGDTGVCVPGAMLAWAIESGAGVERTCPDGTAVAYLVQAVQAPRSEPNRSDEVPLIAGRDALLRVFLTAPDRRNAPVPAVTARFYAGANEVYSIEIPGKSGPLVADTVIDEGDLAASANVRIPGSVLRPGVAMVVETDADPWFGIPRRWPVEGAAPLDVRAVPTMTLTVVPFLWTEDPDSSVVATVRAMAADPDHALLRRSRALLPANDWRVSAHEPVWTDIRLVFDNRSALLARTRAVRVMEGGRGYWMGTGGGFGGGVAWLSAWTNFSSLSGPVIAHELGHNMSLWHAPCGNPRNVDGNFPDRSGRIGAWGYSLDREYTDRWSSFAADEVVPPHTPDVMGYCRPKWISGYHFQKALFHRLRVEASATAAFRGPTRTLMLWGGESESDGLYLESAFVVDAMPVLPDSAGGYRLTGHDAGGRELFSVAFAMPKIADADEDAGAFIYTLPVQPGWEALASVTLTAPDGRTAVLDGSTDRPMTILRDARTRAVRAFLNGPSAAVHADGSTRTLTDWLDAIAITSRGIPSADAWRR